MALQTSADQCNFYFARMRLTQTNPFHTPKRIPCGPAKPWKISTKAGHAIEQETPEQSPGEPTGLPQGSLIKITHHWLELLSVVQSDTPQHISCHTQPIFQQQPINIKKQKYPSLLKQSSPPECQHATECWPQNPVFRHGNWGAKWQCGLLVS